MGHVFLPPTPSQSSKIQILTLFCLPLHSHFSSPSLVLILFLLPQFLLLLLFCFVFGCSSNKTNLLLLRAFVFFICSTRNIWLYFKAKSSTQMSHQRDHSRVKVLPSISSTSLIQVSISFKTHQHPQCHIFTCCICMCVCVCVPVRNVSSTRARLFFSVDWIAQHLEGCPAHSRY